MTRKLSTTVQKPQAFQFKIISGHEKMSPVHTISLDGLDGVGKTTVAQVLTEFINRSGLICKMVRSPIQPFQEIRSQVEQIGGLPALLYYLAGNFASLQDDYLQALEADFVVFDRHVYSTLSYFAEAETWHIWSRLLVNTKRPDHAFHLTLGTHRLRQERLDQRSSLRTGSDAHTNASFEKIERQLKSFNLLKIDNSKNDGGLAAAEQIWEIVRRSL